jgi:hypothetical protein
MREGQMTPRRIAVVGIPQTDDQSDAVRATMRSAEELGHTVLRNTVSVPPVADVVVAVGDVKVPAGKIGLEVGADGTVTRHNYKYVSPEAIAKGG